jgi:hypothetical protein
MNANETQTPKSPGHGRQLLWALLTLTMVAAWPAISQAGEKRAEQAEQQAYSVVRRHVSGLQTCVGRTGVAAKLNVSFNVGPKGRATDIRVDAPDMRGSSVPACVSAAVARWPFPAPVSSRVSFPLLFVQS